MSAKEGQGERSPKKSLSEIQRLAIDLELERYLQLSRGNPDSEFHGLTFTQCVGVGTGHVCGSEIDAGNGVVCCECWNRLEGYQAREKASIMEVLIMEYSVRYGCLPDWMIIYKVIEF